MKTYRQKKSEYLGKLGAEHTLISEGMSVSEKFIEESIRMNLGPISGLLQTLRRIVDTKKDSTREELFRYIIENPDTLNLVEDKIQTLINITRI